MIMMKTAMAGRLNIVGHGTGAISTVIVCVSYLSLINGSLSKSIEQASNDIAKLQSALRRETTTTHDVRHVRSDVSSAENRSAAIRNRIPDSRNEAKLLEDISQVAVTCKLAVLDYRRGRVNEQNELAQFNIDLTCEGSFSAICKFVDALQSLERLVAIEQLTIDADGKDGPYQLSLSVALFYRTESLAVGQIFVPKSRPRMTEVNTT
ncbi:MAG: type 4a pilus biogenesis protein PilO [Planctomycetales bacterium]|nr:type 4a pilus biogenesis protein PilO [Planctomycetales bacterium]